MTRRHLMTLALCGLVPARLGAQPPASALRVERAWVRLPPPERRVTAAFFDLVNDSERAVRLVKAHSPEAGTVELHEMHHEGGMMRMRQVEGIDVPARSTVMLKPGGLHVMLFDVKAGLPPGHRLPLVLEFADGRRVDVAAELRSPVPMP